MRQTLATRAEILKLARVLRRDPDQLGYLDKVAPGDLRELREQVTEVLWSAQSQAFARLAAASRVLPIRVVAAIGERAFGPVLAARISGLLDPGRAVEMANTMPIDFLADVAVELDPRRSGPVITRIPAERIAAITRELVRRHEYVTMGRFVGHLDERAVTAAVEQMDETTLLQVAFVLESKDGLDQLVNLLAPERLQRIVEAVGREGLWAELLDLFANLGPARRSELARHAETLDDAELEALLRAAAEYELWSELLPLLQELSPETQQRIARATAALEPEQRDAVAERVRAAGMHEQLALLDAALAEQQV